MKIGIIGGSAPSTPQLFGCEAMRPALGAIDAVLVGRSEEHLAPVARACRAIAGGELRDLHACGFDGDGAAASLAGSDVVLIQIRAGGYDGRTFDETFPHRFGLPGDEGLGLGGLSAAWRSWPHVSRMLELVRRSCPDALVLMLSSPVGILTRCALVAFPDLRVVGICELPWATLAGACKAVGADPLAAGFRYAGVNHLGWLTDVRAGARDIVADYAMTRDDGFPSRSLILSLGGIPLKYLRLHYDGDAVLREQSAAPVARGRQLAALQSDALTAFQNGDEAAIARALENRPAPWYSLAVGPLIAALARHESSTPLFLTAANGGALSGFFDDDVLEFPHEVVDGSLVRRTDRIGMPKAIEPDLAAFVRYERIAASAVAHQDAAVLRAAIGTHPWVRHGDIAGQAADAIVGGYDRQPTAVATSSK